VASEDEQTPDPLEQRSIDRRAFLRRLAAAGFAVPAVTTFFAADVAGAAQPRPHVGTAIPVPAPLTTTGTTEPPRHHRVPPQALPS